MRMWWQGMVMVLEGDMVRAGMRETGAGAAEWNWAVRIRSVDLWVGRETWMEVERTGAGAGADEVLVVNFSLTMTSSRLSW